MSNNTGFSAGELEVFAVARTAGNGLRKTFECWLDLGHAIEVARRHAALAGGSKKACGIRRAAILSENGLAWLSAKNMSTQVERLGQIMKRLPEVEKWRASLSDYERARWACPQSVFNRCPAFHPDGRKKVPPAIKARPMSVSELMRMPASGIALMLFRRQPSKMFAILRAMEELADTGTVAKPKSGWVADRERAAELRA